MSPRPSAPQSSPRRYAPLPDAQPAASGFAALPQEFVDNILARLDDADLCQLRLASHLTDTLVRTVKSPRFGEVIGPLGRLPRWQSFQQCLRHQSQARAALASGRIATQTITDVGLRQKHVFIMPHVPRAFVSLPKSALVHLDASAKMPLSVVARPRAGKNAGRKACARILHASDLASTTAPSSVVLTLEYDGALGVWVWQRTKPAYFTHLHSLAPLQQGAYLRTLRAQHLLACDGNSILTHLDQNQTSCFWQRTGHTFVQRDMTAYTFNNGVSLGQGPCRESHSVSNGLIVRFDDANRATLTKRLTQQSWTSTAAWPEVLEVDGFSPSGRCVWLTILPQTAPHVNRATAVRRIGLYQLLARPDATLAHEEVQAAPVWPDMGLNTDNWQHTPDTGWFRQMHTWRPSMGLQGAHRFSEQHFCLYERPRQRGDAQKARAQSNPMLSRPHSALRFEYDSQGTKVFLEGAINHSGASRSALPPLQLLRRTPHQQSRPMPVSPTL